jgi:hypothetical protein
MPRYLPTVISDSQISEMSRGFYTGDGTRNGGVFSSGSGLSSTASSGSAVSGSSSGKSKK